MRSDAARHLELSCMRLLATVRARVLGTEHARQLASIDAELEELYALDATYPLDALAAELALDPDEVALLTLAIAWELFPEETLPLDPEASHEVLTAGRMLALLFSGSAQRIAARHHLERRGHLWRHGLVVLVEDAGERRGVGLIEHTRVFPAAHVIAHLLGEPPPSIERGAPAATFTDGLVAFTGTRANVRRDVATLLPDHLRIDLRTFEVHEPAFALRLEAMMALARFHELALHLEEASGLFAHPRATRALLAAVRDHAQVVAISWMPSTDSNAGEALLRDVALVVLESEPPDSIARRALWSHALTARGQHVEDTELALLARQFQFDAADIDRAARLAAAEHHAASFARVHAAARRVLPKQLDTFAVRVPTDLGFDDLVLAETTRAELSELVDACRARVPVIETWGFGRGSVRAHGVIALFDGEPGTGKTLTAGILANALGLPLYRIDVAQLVDKYVGETEKHIEVVFQSARASHAVLLFDEADALFTKRTSVGNAMDRFANMQTNTLLQEIEGYDGIVVLTTNLEANFDPAMRRRIHFKIGFPFPTASERARLWRLLLPERVPTEGALDFGALGDSFELSGGYIRNAVLRASYRAWSRSEPITMTALEAVAAAECRASGKLFRAMKPRATNRLA